ncbi:MAG: hypothetical protein H6Q70_4219 [Firmicutes bacterium]|nr:hypothetical protein [Bacillota bacterium]
MSTNISKQKREELISKIKSVHTFIAEAEQDENTGNLLSYLSELEKEVKGKKYGLVFEEHRESIDDILETHMYLKDRTNKDGTCYPAIGTIAKDLKLSRRTVQRAIADLEQSGHLIKEQRWRENGGKSSLLFTVK